MNTPQAAPAKGFTGYQKFVIAILAFLQFTIILDFMIISPLGAMVMPALEISPQQFGWIVSVYAFAAGASGLLAAGFADRFDRKRLLLFFYVGFLLGTLLCGVASDFHLLLAARIVTGVFAMEQRGRVMGFMQTAFAASQILGLPAGLYFSNWWNWHAPFIMIVVIGTVVGVIIALRLKPVDAHLHLKQEHSAFGHLMATLTEPRYLLAFCTTALLATGGYMLMPFGSAFTVNNLKIGLDHLPTIYLVTGICTIFIGPIVGRLSDKVGKFQTFLFGTALSIVTVLYYTRLGPTPLIGVILINVFMFLGIFSRMIPSQALMTAIPAITKRGAFNAISSSIQQVSGGVASVLAGMIVLQSASGELEHFNRIGYVVVGASLISLFFMYRIHKAVPEKTA
jgi:predicted MFS family arabinose efflux permease